MWMFVPEWPCDRKRLQGKAIKGSPGEKNEGKQVAPMGLISNSYKVEENSAMN